MNTETACIHLDNTYTILVTSPELAGDFLRKQDVIFASRPYNMSGKLASNGQNPLTYGLVNVRIAAQHYCDPGLAEEEHVDGLFIMLKYVYGFVIADYLFGGEGTANKPPVSAETCPNAIDMARNLEIRLKMNHNLSAALYLSDFRTKTLHKPYFGCTFSRQTFLKCEVRQEPAGNLNHLKHAYFSWSYRDRSGPV
ncbi:UNVERIFIED_CONTAM: Tryptophan N-monooxygenase [Sesamum calycinum]|uniref:Tryptophan N-monooxygenase n=1 Tax=Sesamum calycinum TaxID=2727403 RepID=A0AAW2QK24_9LAMI